ncbi:unnamed protein product [Boreogadus saida]
MLATPAASQIDSDRPFSSRMRADRRDAEDRCPRDPKRSWRGEGRQGVVAKSARAGNASPDARQNTAWEQDGSTGQDAGAARADQIIVRKRVHYLF